MTSDGGRAPSRWANWLALLLLSLISLAGVAGADRYSSKHAKREESSAPLKAALRDMLKQRQQLWGLMTANATLEHGWNLERDPHDLLAPLLVDMYSRSFGQERDPSFDPYPSNLHKVPAAPKTLNRNNSPQAAGPLEDLSGFPFPSQAYYSTVSGFWNSPAWAIRPEFIAYSSSSAHNRNLKRDSKTFLPRKSPIDTLPGGRRARFGHRQRDLLTLLFGPDYPGSTKEASLNSYAKDIKGGGAYIFLSEDNILPGRISSLGGHLQLMPASTSAKRPSEGSPGQMNRRQDAAVGSPNNITSADAEDETTEAIRKYMEYFTYESPHEKASEGVIFDLDGLHFVKQGLLYAHALPVESPVTTDPRETLAMIPLPKTPSPPASWASAMTTRNFTDFDRETSAWLLLNETYNALESILTRRIEHNNKSIQAERMIDMESRIAHHNCSFHFYGHLKPAGPVSLRPQLQELEQEMRNPSGISTIKQPPSELHGLLFSPDCFLALTFAPARGDLDISRAEKSIRYSICFFLVLIVQSLLTTRQMDRSMTPSAISKISSISWSMQCLIEVGIFGFHIVFPILENNRSSKSMMACAFLAATLFIALQYQHTLTMWHIQTPAFRRPPAESAAGSTTMANTATTPEGTTEATPIPPFWRRATALLVPRVRRHSTALTWIASITAFLVMQQVPGNVSLLLLYSFWVPQIWRNIKRGARKAVERRYIIGISLCRLFLPAYYLGCPANWLRYTDLNYPLLFVTTFWLCLQASILIGQSFFGTHFFVPRNLRPKDLSWDWHPPLSTLAKREDPETGAMTVGDCSVCLSPIESATSHVNEEDGDAEEAAEPELQGLLSGNDKAEESGSSTRRARSGLQRRSASTLPGRWFAPLAILAQPLIRGLPRTMQLSARHNVMVTPCHHIFHTSCLEQWLQVKTECPQCRAPLPPV
ncbi:hypothetical protein K437DRAFT_253748 [Tilletiaria anomala UBC 951]|uniref:RING-type E3 ubiquitin transferase n=1 Tax=Tilletiaria anomala (strain ATCC 24038 / CBS 436.72 / UBC 951) TaxID=1037660 RepID=A0A066WQB7_TILAU|nr:uncharacterized protein K437DRAFT_253748 [Tilletiaria anomala UBC 951]KDN52815.1 hypothetical protein K437DRAFT_253748 [Tilletiaria anomala UBC 951]